jgi:ubiquinone/menaquinone biosynthesis C-methylase UbiE
MTLDQSFGRAASVVNQGKNEKSFYDPDAKTESIIFALSQELVSPNQNKEKICIYLLQLQSRGLEGQAALRYLASGSDYVSEQAGKYLKLISGDDANGVFAQHLELEKKLGINRMINIVDRDKLYGARLIKILYDYALTNGLWMKEEGDVSSFENAIRNFERNKSKDGQLPVQVTADIEEEILSSGATFGVDEINYLEGLGPRKLLELRNTRKPSFLLIGTLGRYSAKEFALTANKINKGSQKLVVDINPLNKHFLGKTADNLKIKFDIASATDLPYPDKSIDLIMTNHLLHNLVDITSMRRGNPETIFQVLKEAFRVLKPEGEIILVEQPYGRFLYEMTKAYSDAHTISLLKEMQADISSIAARAGFKKKFFSNELRPFTFRADVSSAKIDECGFPNYGNKSISVSRTSGIAVKLVK